MIAGDQNAGAERYFARLLWQDDLKVFKLYGRSMPRYY